MSQIAIDGNEATARIAHKVSEVIAIYPITPSSNMAEHSDLWSAKGQKNIWGEIPKVSEMQSEGGASGAVHGALQAGALCTTFTASQGLLLMIPNMYKIAGELTSTVFHVSARALAAQALSIFGDHSDVMSVRQTGFALLSSGSPLEAQDMALVAHAATLKSRIPFIHFFDGFRTSHEVLKFEAVSDDVIEKMIDQDLVVAHRDRGLSPERPVTRGTAQNPDVYFQGRETVNPFYEATPAIVQEYMDRFAELTGRRYNLVDYVGAADAEEVIVIMGSGALAVTETVEYLNKQGRKTGILNVHLYRPFPTDAFLKAIPASVKKITVLDRTKEPGSIGEPLYQDVITALAEGIAAGKRSEMPRVLGGRYGLGSKEFTPAMIISVFDNMMADSPKNHFAVGIHEDVTGASLDWDETLDTESGVFRGLFYGLGADGTVGANKNSIKIIASETNNHAQGYFVYDSKKSGSMTTSHLRFGKKPIHSTYLIPKANFVAVHYFPFLEQVEILSHAEEAATLLLNTPYSAEDTWAHMPRSVQQQIVDKKLEVHYIDASKVAKETGMGRRINTVMQVCFFAISGIIEKSQAIAAIKAAIKKTYGSKGDAIVQMNFAAVDGTLDNLKKMDVPSAVTSEIEFFSPIDSSAPAFVQDVTKELIQFRGDQLPVSKMPVDGTFPPGTTKWEKRDLSQMVPVWDEELCTQCGKCALVCPHGVIRSKAVLAEELVNAPSGVKSISAKAVPLDKKADPRYIIQTSVQDCTGCEVCVEVCPGTAKDDPNRKSLSMANKVPFVKEAEEAWDFFIKLPEVDRTQVKVKTVKGSQLLQPLFEFSGACPGCGETPYVKLISQLFGDRMLVANATGCSSIYGGNLPTSPWGANNEGRGTAWSNSLFEDNAEFGMGFRLALDKHTNQALNLLNGLNGAVPEELKQGISDADMSTELGLDAQRSRVVQLKEILGGINSSDAKLLVGMADYLVKKSVWIVGGDGWAYDIGFGGLDHVMASGENVNILVLDTEVYSNTGGQMSKATSKGAVAQFAAGGKPTGKKDLALMAMSYGNVYVGKVAMGKSDSHTVKTFIEAEAHDGPSIIIAYSPCIAHGFDISQMLKHQALAVDTGYWQLYRYNPALTEKGKNPFQLDSKAPTKPVAEFLESENRFRSLYKTNPDAAKRLAEESQVDADAKWKYLEGIAALEQ